MFLKKIVPRSLYSRFLLIIIAPMVLAQLVAVYMFYERHWSTMSRHLASSLSGEIALVLRQMEHSRQEDFSEIFLVAKQYMGLDAIFRENEYIDVVNIYAPEYTLLAEGLRKHFSYPFVISPAQDSQDIVLKVQWPNSVLEIRTTQKRLANPTTYIFIMWMTGTATIFLIVSIMFLKNQVRSIVRLTEAAEKFGKGQDMPSFKPQGAKEIRRAAIAFIEMRERIKRLLTRRTQMLAGISHDLRTPLTRMKLQLAMSDNTKETKELKTDVDEMEKMLEGYLDFVRGETGDAAKEKSTDIELSVFINGIIKGCRTYKGKIENNIAEHIILHGRPILLKRCFVNFIDNAMRYGSHIKIDAQEKADFVAITIDDNGPGIPVAERKKVFQPFYRIEHSRNKETGGVGLGLPIARDIIHAHGGEVSLKKSPIGGLRVEIKLPV